MKFNELADRVTNEIIAELEKVRQFFSSRGAIRERQKTMSPAGLTQGLTSSIFQCMLKNILLLFI
jgi:TolB-like protein